MTPFYTVKIQVYATGIYESYEYQSIQDAADVARLAGEREFGALLWGEYIDEASIFISIYQKAIITSSYKARQRMTQHDKTAFNAETQQVNTPYGTAHIIPKSRAERLFINSQYGKTVNKSGEPLDDNSAYPDTLKAPYTVKDLIEENPPALPACRLCGAVVMWQHIHTNWHNALDGRREV